MLVLALDTATARITAGVVELPAAGPPRPLSHTEDEGARAHAERLAPGIRAAVTEAGLTTADLDAVVCGVGPGPFTGLRVGMVTAAAFGDGLALPVHGVCTHDALTAAADTDPDIDPAPAGSVLAVTDARRREVYWTLSTAGVRTRGPEVSRPADLADLLRADGTVRLAVGDAAGVLADLVDGLVAAGPPGPSPASLVTVAAAALRSDADPGPLVPLYLRRPDAVPPGAPKAVVR